MNTYKYMYMYSIMCIIVDACGVSSPALNCKDYMLA